MRPNRSGFKGVSWYGRYLKWRAQVKVNGVHRHVGYFDEPEEAAKAYEAAVSKFQKGE